ncbi:GNAT family N-acetyltransferase [Streptomyces sp. NPDC101151]|uniref:GNAT family N-acetyltransferase n=1 Tax=Streptomyces sp. NPDC101151 TaxID=3366115 RepID=UPI00380C0A0B
MANDEPFSAAEMRIVELMPGEAQAEEDLYSVLGQLRPALTPHAYGELLAKGSAQGLRYLLAYGNDGTPLGAAGWRVLTTSRGRILMLEDLVTDQAARSSGVGAALMTAVRDIGRSANCVALELDSGVGNAAAHRFYFRHGMSVLSFHFAMPLGSLDH